MDWKLMERSDQRIYTKRGDTGQTRLLSEEIVEKDDVRVTAYGCLDELQAHLGMARAMVRVKPVHAILYRVQQDLFVAGSELASTSQYLPRLKERIGQREITRIEHEIDSLTDRYGLPTHFVVPGRSLESSTLHVARSVCRRCERLIIELNRQVGDYSILIPYFNRLSDLLFVLAWTLEVLAVVEAILRDLFRAEQQQGCANQDCWLGFPLCFHARK
jgi:cob(I)alamin adenosyltransferase